MSSQVDELKPADTPVPQSIGGRARSGTFWIVGAFGLGQVMRLAANVALASILFEEVFALMGIVVAVMSGLAMFSDIGIHTNVIQHRRGDDPDFLNTAWTLQVIRGVGLFLIAIILAWPMSRIYGANDPAGYALLYLIPLVALTSLLDGFQSAKLMSAMRHLQIKKLTLLEFAVGALNIVLMLVLAWYMRSVYALAIASVVSCVLHLVLTYRMLDGAKCTFRWDSTAVHAIVSFGKWIFLSTVCTFLASQLDRLSLAAMFNLTEVGVYSIAASLAVMVPTLAGKLQWSVLFPWYSRKLEEGMPLPMAFARTRTAMMAFSSFLCACLFAGAHSFFAMAYDDRYAMGAVLLPILALGAWFSCLEAMYGATFMASGRPMWSAISNASKVITYAILLGFVSVLGLDIVTAAMFLVVSEVMRWLVCHLMGRRLGLRNARAELGMFAFFIVVSMAGWWLVERAPVVSELRPFWRLSVLAAAISLLFAPVFWRFVMPLVKRR